MEGREREGVPLQLGTDGIDVDGSQGSYHWQRPRVSFSASFGPHEPGS